MSSDPNNPGSSRAEQIEQDGDAAQARPPPSLLSNVDVSIKLLKELYDLMAASPENKQHFPPEVQVQFDNCRAGFQTWLRHRPARSVSYFHHRHLQQK
jgi:hypothetical protein